MLFSRLGGGRRLSDTRLAGSPLARRLRDLSPLDRRTEARAFLRLFHLESNAGEAAFRKRWSEVRRQLKRTGTYDHTPAELAFGARVAWRNHGRCIGRLYWESLEVVDCRHIEGVDEIGARLNDHMRESLAGGQVRSIISIFAPVKGTEMPSYFESGQLIQYAGYHQDRGPALGDRRNVAQTDTAKMLGWQPPEEPSAFDILPVVMKRANASRVLIDLDPTAMREVPIRHPDHEALGAMGLKWYAVPYVSDMILTIGGIDYPCAPFNGFYMCTEIASRNLVDEDRYGLLPAIAEALGFGTDETENPLWKDAALTELNRAVLYSFKAANVTVVDHHSASDSFIEFTRREQSKGRHCAADWAWIVPPQASGALDVFDLPMKDFHPVPNYYRSRADDGEDLMPYSGDLDLSKSERHLERVRRRWKHWRQSAKRMI